MADLAIRTASSSTSESSESPQAFESGEGDVTTRRRVRRLGPGKRIPFARGVGPLLLVAAWSIASATGRLDPRILPAPWSVVDDGWQLWRAGTLGPDLEISLQRAAEGFALGLVAAVVLALVAGLSRVGAALIDGNVQINRSLPILGMIPLFILWLGIGETFKISIIAIAVYIPIYINLSAALSAIDRRYVELAETLGLSRWEFLRRSSSRAPCPASSPGCGSG